MSFSNVVGAADFESKMTFPLAMKVSTLEKPMSENKARSLSIVTVRPPTLIARRKATYLGMLMIVLSVLGLLARIYGLTRRSKSLSRNCRVASRWQIRHSVRMLERSHAPPPSATGTT
jgi:hypothetical protein